ncbi:MAG: MerR family transcriptional regulator [Alphaproteobacteria bacterium]|nr:MerR family transcriptional regulator [Alphaproteobacteria bacterium]
MTEPFLSINEASKRLDVPAHTLRYWEKQFPAAIKPATGAGGRRYYRPETIAALERIKSLLYDCGMTIAGVKKVLRGEVFPSCGGVAAPGPAEIVDFGGWQSRGGSCNARDLNEPPRLRASRESTPPQEGNTTPDISRAIELLELAKAELA